MFRIVLAVPEYRVVEGITLAVQLEGLNLAGNGIAELDQAVCKVHAQSLIGMHYVYNSLKIRSELCFIGRVLGIDMYKPGPILGCKLFSEVPVQFTVPGMGGSVARSVIFAVTPSFAGLEPKHRGLFFLVVNTNHCVQLLCERGKIRTVFSAENFPAMRSEPILGLARQDITGLVPIDAIVIPVYKEVQVVQSHAPGGVKRLVGGPWGKPSFTFHDEDLHIAGSCSLQRKCQTGCCRGAMTGRAGVGLQK
ncbi:hypothetical protein SDC9_112070 [bioreactor metagenome]|uniref:Uncharacterized protein n=1 Tax=bioreactor metagenome TaxID=1076179 RepID=A0A645BJB1_9ZZZZ